ncbi:MAG TPA: zf-HC2 domain-containing protein [Kofleriaceae bacterium]|jgi:anti-sigma factor RsiW
MSLCESIDTLAMAYLDDELAPEELRELETHLTECTSCRGEVDTARADQSLIQTSLAAPRATDTMRMRLLRSFDEADRDTARAERKRMSSWLLPGGAIAAAAAAILVFVGVGFQPHHEHMSIAHVAAELEEHPLAPVSLGGSVDSQPILGVDLPMIDNTSSKLLSKRLLNVDNHRAALVAYDITHGGRRAVLKVLVVTDLHDGEMTDGDETQANGRWVHVGQDQGLPFVTYVDAKRNGYMFSSDSLSADELIDLVGKTSLVGPQ